MTTQCGRALKRVTGLAAATALASKLTESAPFFQVTRFPGDEYEFAVMEEDLHLLADPVVTCGGHYEPADFTSMNQDELVAWYVKNVGYDPVADDPSTELEELRARCAEMLEIDQSGGLDSD